MYVFNNKIIYYFFMTFIINALSFDLGRYAGNPVKRLLCIFL